MSAHPNDVLVAWWRRGLETLAVLLGDMLTSPETKLSRAKRDVDAMLAEDAPELARAELEAVGPLEVTQCRSCSADVVWIKTKRGKLSICDARPRMVMTLAGEMVRGWESHYASCPNAEQWRRKR